ncbi:unnamed protein product [Echinostoma caproni]|uniref:Ala_racemase_N domain-containing protein n=1 Tax=Echinostoma caproni TaxID=27848 RepID=A0A183B7U8_9TREM|nr:unnamed protein product [Echinostoma caproni]
MLKMVSKNVNEVSSNGHSPPRLVAVSKEKPVDMIIQAYEAGQKYFGENKVLKKSRSQSTLSWHFIGRIQSNKIKKLTGIFNYQKNLAMVETVDSADHAELLNSSWGAVSRKPLPVLIQVNTSGEPQKGGVHPDEIVRLFQHVKDNCPNLCLKGLMCIGMQFTGQEKHPNPDFVVGFRIVTNLLNAGQSWECRMISKKQFISLGSTSVRVGTTIFGER